MAEEHEIPSIPVRSGFDVHAVPEVYSNAVGIHSSSYDMLLRFVLQSPNAEGTEMSERLVAQVRLSHAQAWTMCKVLDRVLNRVIDAGGPISVPEDVIAKLGLLEEYKAMQGRTRP